MRPAISISEQIECNCLCLEKCNSWLEHWISQRNSMMFNSMCCAADCKDMAKNVYVVNLVGSEGIYIAPLCNNHAKLEHDREFTIRTTSDVLNVSLKDNDYPVWRES
ncbi:MAG: hypothetical protein U0T69_04195 [Chitinophagales bacterium]